MAWTPSQQSLLTVVCVTLLAQTSALYTKKGPVTQLTTRTFSKAVLDSNLPAVVEFYAPWCGHCKALAPQYQKVAESLQGIATVAAVDCDDTDNQPLCGEYKVQGFPTLKIFPANKPRASAKSRKKLPSDYNGPRTAKAIADALTAALPASQISKVKDAQSFTNFTNTASSLPKVVLFTDKPRTSALYKSLSLRFMDRLAFAEVSSKAADVVEAQGVTSFPKLVVLKAEQEEEYSGKFKAADLISFLSKQAGSASKTEADDSASQGSEKGTGQKEKQKQEDKEEPKIVRELNVTEFEGLSDEEDAWLVAFYSDDTTGSKCSKELTDWNKVNFQLGGLTLAAQVNVSAGSPAEQEQLQQVGIDVSALQKAPCALQMALLPFGEKDEPLLFTGNRTAKELHAFAVATFPDIVTRISSSTLDSVFGSTMSQPKVVLFTEKESTPGMFRALAASFRKYNLLFFTMHSSDEQAKKTFNIQKVPAVVLAFLPPGAETEAGGATGPTQLQLQPYPGPLKYPFLAGWLTMAAQELKLMPEGTSNGGDTAGAAAAAAVPEVTTSEAFRQHCTNLTGLCIVAALNPSADDFAAQKASFQSVANSRASSALHYLWLDVTRQGPFWEGLGVGRGDAPTAVAIRLKKRRQARLDSGAFSETGLKAFVERLVGGRSMTTPLQEFPTVVDGGQDAAPHQIQVEEEEFDLSDIMAEQLEAQVGTKEDRLRQLEEQEEEEAKRRLQESAAKTPKRKKKSKSGKKKPVKPSAEL